MPRRFEPNCGYKVEAMVGLDNRVEGAVNRYYIAITYSKPIFDELTFRNREEALAQQRKLEEDTRRAQQNKPQL
jgi:hypothetical protein